MKESKYFEQLENQAVRCTLCPHFCVINEGKRGICKVRINKNGRLYSLSYGNIIAIHIDPMEKKPLYHFFPAARTLSIATPGCNFRCLNCQNYTISQVNEDIFEFTRELPPEELIKMAVSENLKHITFTYTEPTVFFEYMLETAKSAKREGLFCSVVSNGFINIEPLKELLPYIDAANIDLKFKDNELYRKITGGLVEPVLNTVGTLYDSGIVTEVTTLIIPDLNDGEDYFRDMAKMLLNISDEIPWHLSAFYPSFKMSDYPSTVPSVLIAFRKIALELGCKYVYTGNILDLEGSTTFCPNCGKKLVERHYYNLRIVDLDGDKCPECGQKIYGKF